MMNEYLVSAELLRTFESQDCRVLEPELEEERLKALREATCFPLHKLSSSILNLMNKDETEDCTATIRKNLKDIKEEPSVQRQRTLTGLLGKYIKKENNEEDNLFIEYMKRQVCADLPHVSRLIDLIYKRCPEINMADRLDILNNAVYDAFLEYISTPHLLVPNNKAERVKGERLACYNSTEIETKGADIHVRNILKNENITVACISKRELYCLAGSARHSPETHWHLDRFVRYVLTADREPLTEETFYIKLADVSGFREVEVQFQDSEGLYSFETTMRPYTASGKRLFTEMYTASETVNNDFKVVVGMNTYDAAENRWFAPRFMLSAKTYIEGTYPADDYKVVAEAAGKGLTDVLHRLLRRDHALEDIITLFVQLLAVENKNGINTEGSLMLFGHSATTWERDKTVKAVMAAIIAPVKKTLSGFTIAPELDTIAEIAGMEPIETAFYLYRFALAFGLEFMTSQVRNFNACSASYYVDRLMPGIFRMTVFHGLSASDGILGYCDNDCIFDVLRPRLKKLLLTHASMDTYGTKSVLSQEDVAKALTLNMAEAIALNQSSLMDAVFKPALSFYFSIMETIMYVSGFKAASLMPYYMEHLLVSKHITQEVKLKTIVYGMGNGLIHSVFESAGDNNEQSPVIAVPVSQYIIPEISADIYEDGVLVHKYIKTIMTNIRFLLYFLGKNSKILKKYQSDSEAADIGRQLPDFKQVRTLYMSDPDSINSFAPGFRGVFKPGDRGILEDKLAQVRKKVEESYYVIASRRPLVPEEYLEDEQHSISMRIDADRENVDVDMTLYSDISASLGIRYSVSVNNQDADVVSMDARYAGISEIYNNSDACAALQIQRKYILMGSTTEQTSVLSQALGLSGYPYSVIRALTPSSRNIPVRHRRRGYPMIGLFVEKDGWSMAGKVAASYGVCTYPPLYQITDRRKTSGRLPVLALSEFSGRSMIDVMTNGVFNSASDRIFPEGAAEMNMTCRTPVVPNQILRLTADSAYLDSYTNYRFMEAVRRRWNPDKYPKYKSFAYIRQINKDACSGTSRAPAPYNQSPWQLDGRTMALDTTLSGNFLAPNEIGESLRYICGSIVRESELKMSSALHKYDVLRSDQSEGEKPWAQIWLEEVIKRTNESGGNRSVYTSLDPYNYPEGYARHILASLYPEYRCIDRFAVQTLVDTEDITKGFNMYIEPIDPDDDSIRHMKARMQLVSIFVLKMVPPCQESFLDAINDTVLDTSGDVEPQEKKVESQYDAICRTRELTKIATEVKVNSTKILVDKEIRELRRQKEEYCRNYRTCMLTLKKQRKAIVDGRSFLNNNDLFTEDEIGIQSLHDSGQILGYRLIYRDRTDSSGGESGTSRLLDTNDFLANKGIYLRHVADGRGSIDLMVLTAPVYIWSGAFIFSIGKVTIHIKNVFDMVNIKPQFYNEDTSMFHKFINAGISSDEIPRQMKDLIMDAPHVRNHRPCVGNLELNLNDAAKNDDLLAYIEWCLVYLSTVKLGDPYGSALSYFPCVSATMHNVIKYGVFDAGRVDDRICLWTGAGLRPLDVGCGPLSTMVVQPVWNMSKDLVAALYNDAVRKMEDGLYAGSDIVEDDLLPIARELMGQAVSNDNSLITHKIFRNLLSYSMLKTCQDEEPGHTISESNRAVFDPYKFDVCLRAGIRQKLEHREYYTQRSLNAMEVVINKNLSLSDLWKKNNIRDDDKINLELVKDARLQAYHINI